MKKNLITLLSLVLLLSMLLASCKGNKPNSEDTDPNESGTKDPQIEDELSPGLESVAYDRTIRILQREDREREEWDPEGESFVILEEALVKRNAYLTDKYSIDFQYVNIQLADTVEEIQVPVLANTYICDFMSFSPMFTASLAQAGALHTIQSVPNIDLSKPWWYQELNDALSYRDTNFFVIGSANLFTLWRTSCVYYNTSLASAIGLNPDDFYELVKNKQWTLNALLEAAEDCNHIDNTPSGAGVEDRYAFSNTIGGWYANFYGTGLSFTERDENGRWVVTNGGEVAGDRLKAIIQLFNDAEVSLPLSIAATEGWKHFSNGSSLFLEEAICVFNSFKDTTLEYGILPSPLLVEGQEKYYTTFHKNHSSAISVPASVSTADLDMVGRIVEDATWQAQKVQWPAFYDTLLKGRAAQNPEDAEMIEYIFTNVVIDPAILYTDKIENAVRSLIGSNDLFISSTMDPAVGQAQFVMNNVMTSIDQILDKTE